MATTLNSQPEQKYVDFDEYVNFQLQKTRSTIKTTDVLTATAGIANLLLGYLLVFVVFDHWVIPGGFGDVARIVALSTLLLASVVWTTWKILWPWRRRVSGLYAARAIEIAEPNLESNLLNLVDLQREGKQIAPEVREAIEKRAALSISKMDLDQAVDRRPLLYLSYVLLALVVTSCLYTLISPKKITSSVWRALLPTADVGVSTRTEIVTVKPGDTSVLARTQLDVTALLRGDIPERVTLFYTTADRRFVDEPVELRLGEDGLQEYAGRITGENGRGILQDMTYFIEAGDTRTREFHVAAVQPPSAHVDQVAYTHPSYMELEPRVQLSGHIDTWEGTTLQLTATANMPLRSAVILFSDTEDTSVKAEEIPLKISDGIHLTAEWTASIRSDGTFPRYYRIQCRNLEGKTNPDPALYSVRIHPDQSPQVNLVDPTQDIEMPANGIVPLMIEAADPDFQLRFLKLVFSRAGEPDEKSEMIFEGYRQALNIIHDFQLERFDFQPGDVISYWIEAQDNKQPVHNRKNTSPLQIRIVGKADAEEVQEQLQQDRERQQEQLEKQQADPQNAEATDNPAQPESAEQRGEEQRGEEQGSEGQDTQPGTETEPQPDSKSANKQDSGKQSETGEETSASENSTTDKPNQTPQSEGQSGQEKKPGLQKDGSDDDEALRKIYEKLSQNEKQAPDKPNDAAKDGQSPNDAASKPDTDPSRADKPDTKPEPNASPKPGSPESDDQAPQTPDEQKSATEKSGDNDKEPQGAGGEESGQTGNDDPEQTPDGKPSQTKSADESGRAGEGNEAPDENAPLDPNAKPGEDTSGSRTEKPAKSDADAKREKATGDERGPAEADNNPDADPTAAKNELERDPADDPATRPAQPRSNQDPSTKPPQQAGKTDNPDPASQEQQSKSNPNPDQQPSTPNDKGQDATSEKQETPNAGNPPADASDKPKTTDTENPQGGDGGSNQQSDQGKTGSKNPGAGDTGQKSGDGNQSTPPQDGQGGGDPQGGSEAQGSSKDGGKSGKDGKGGGDKPPADGQSPSDQDQGSSDSQESDPQERSSQSDSQASGSEQSAQQGGGKSKDAQGSQAGGGQNPSSSNPSGGAANGGVPSKNGGGGEGGGDASAAEAAKLEHAKQAADLVLKRLQKDLERGEVSPELLDELGWTNKDVQRFADRLQRQLQGADKSETPESIARRRQFEEMLKGLDLQNTGTVRRGSEAPQRAAEGIGPRRIPIPAEYRDAYEAYRRSLSKRSNRD